jgi:hypothetical protein
VSTGIGVVAKPGLEKIKAFSAANPETLNQANFVAGKPLPGSFAGTTHWGLVHWENDMPGGWIAIIVLCLLLAAALFGAYQGWTAHSGGIDLPDWGYALLGVGIVFGLVVGCGLMALAFYSSRSGYDEPPVVQQKDEHDVDDHH